MSECMDFQLPTLDEILAWPDWQRAALAAGYAFVDPDRKSMFPNRGLVCPVGRDRPIAKLTEAMVRHEKTPLDECTIVMPQEDSDGFEVYRLVRIGELPSIADHKSHG